MMSLEAHLHVDFKGQFRIKQVPFSEYDYIYIYENELAW